MKKQPPTQEEIARSQGIATATALFKIFDMKVVAVVDKNMITPMTWDKDYE